MFRIHVYTDLHWHYTYHSRKPMLCMSVSHIEPKAKWTIGVSIWHVSRSMCECQSGQTSCVWMSAALRCNSPRGKDDAYFLLTTLVGDTLFLIFPLLFSLHLLYQSSPTLLTPGPAATGAGPHQPVHLQPAGVYGWAGAGEHAEAPGSRHLHEDTEGCQRGQQRSRLCQVGAPAIDRLQERYNSIPKADMCWVNGELCPLSKYIHVFHMVCDSPKIFVTINNSP